MQSHAIQKYSIPLYGPLDINDPKRFIEKQKAIFKACFYVRCPYQIKVDDFVRLDIVGEGGFGKVFLVKHLKYEKNVFYAMKVMKKKEIVENKYISFALNEKRILQSLNFPFCVRLEYLAQDKINLYYFLPFVSGGDMFRILRKFKKFDEDTAKFYAAQIVLAVEFLHYCDLVYRDLKPENVLIDHLGYIKITDFGFAKIVPTRTYTFCGTPEYIAPEIILGLGHGKPVDFWTLGVLIYEMVKGDTPFRSDNDLNTFKKIVKLQYEMPTTFSEPLKDLITNLLQVNISYRCGNLLKGIEDIKEHTWFKKINWLNTINRKLNPPYVPPKVVRDFPDGTPISGILKPDSSNSGDYNYDEHFKDF